MAKVVAVNSDSMAFMQSAQFFRSRNWNGVDERVLERPIHKIILFQEAEV